MRIKKGIIFHVYRFHKNELRSIEIYRLVFIIMNYISKNKMKS